MFNFLSVKCMDLKTHIGNKLLSLSNKENVWKAREEGGALSSLSVEAWQDNRQRDQEDSCQGLSMFLCVCSRGHGGEGEG